MYTRLLDFADQRVQVLNHNIDCIEKLFGFISVSFSNLDAIVGG